MHPLGNCPYLLLSLGNSRLAAGRELEHRGGMETFHPHQHHLTKNLLRGGNLGEHCSCTGQQKVKLRQRFQSKVIKSAQKEGAGSWQFYLIRKWWGEIK